MSKFSIGEVAVYVSFRPVGKIARRIGQECKIIDPLGTKHARGGLPQYGIKFACGTESWAIEKALRKLPPPPQELTTWDKCVFQPKDRTVEVVV